MSRSSNAEPEGLPARADARRNRAAVLSAAHRLFAAEGIESSMPTIAQMAGVAVGTIYRHYASKEQLIEAVVVERLEAIIELAERALVGPNGTPFATFFRQVAALCVEDGRFASVVSEVARISPAGRDADQRLQEVLSRLLHTAKERGELRLQLDPIDIPILLAGVRRAAQQHDPTRWERYINIVLSGVSMRSEP